MLRRILDVKICNKVFTARPISNAVISFYKEINESNSDISISTSIVRSLPTINLPDLINGLSKVKKSELEPDHLTRIFSKIFELYKNDFEQNSIEIIKSSGFRNCCSILKYHAPRMMPNDLVVCLKSLVSLNMNSHSKIIQQLLYHIKEEINELSLSQLAFLNYLLCKMDQTPIVNALKIAIPIVFDLNISLKLDHENPEEILKILQHVYSTEMKISDKSMMNLISALALHGTNLSVYNAQTVLSAVRILPFKYFENYQVLEKLVQNCFHILNTKFDESTFPRMELILGRLIRKYKFSDIDVFYNETFYNNCVNHLIKNDLGFSTAYHVLKKFNEIQYVNYKLLDYIDQQIIQNHTNLSTMHLNQLMHLMTGFSNGNYKSKNWEIIKSILHENPELCNNISMDMPHLKFICELLSLDFISKIYFNKILNENFLFEYLKRNGSKKFANLPQLRLIYQVLLLLHPEYDGILPKEILLNIANEAIPLETTEMNEIIKNDLEKIFGPGTVQMNMLTKYGHMLDFVISFDNQDKAISMPYKLQYYEDIPKSHVRSVVVFFHSRKNCPINLPGKLRGIISLRKRTLETLGIKQVDIATHSLDQLPDYEKSDYIEREIRHSLE